MRNIDYERPATAEGVAQATAVDLFVRDSWSLKCMIELFPRTLPVASSKRPGLILFAASALEAYACLWLLFSEKDAGTNFCYRGLKIALVISQQYL